MSKAKIAILKEAIRLVEAKEGTIESIVIGVNNVWLANNECYPLPYGEYKRRAWLMDDLVRMLAQLMEEAHAEALAMDAEISEATAAMNAAPNRDMTPEQCLRTFLASWLAWAELDAPKHEVFDPVFGLCWNLEGWACEHCQHMGNDVADLTIAIMQDRLEHEDYPFGRDSYLYDVDNRTHHRHAPRLEWVRAQLADLV